MKKIFIFIALSLPFLSGGCGEFDNYDEPASVLSGKVVHNSQPVGVRSNATQLELWQDGFALRTKIEVFIAYDGTFHAKLFDGEYKIVRLSGAPWENNTADTIKVTVRGDTQVDVPVVPYFTVPSAVTYRKDGNDIVATFTVQQVSATASLESVSLYLNPSIITDQNYNAANASVAGASVTLGQEVTVRVAVPASLASADYLYARVGVKANQSGERYYTSPQQIRLR